MSTIELIGGPFDGGGLDVQDADLEHMTRIEISDDPPPLNRESLNVYRRVGLSLKFWFDQQATNERRALKKEVA